MEEAAWGGEGKKAPSDPGFRLSSIILLTKNLRQVAD